jgi:hypothetical protein
VRGFATAPGRPLACIVRPHMRRFRLALLPALLGCAFDLLAASDSSATLSALASELDALANRTVANTYRSTCRAEMQQLVGLSKSAILSALGDPGDCSGSCQSSPKLSYSFSGPLPPGQRGGGFPIMTLTFSQADIVVTVACVYAR